MFESVTKHDNKKYNFLISDSSRCHNRHGRNWQDNKNIVLVKKLCFNFLAILIELNFLKKKNQPNFHRPDDDFVFIGFSNGLLRIHALNAKSESLPTSSSDDPLKWTLDHFWYSSSLYIIQFVIALYLLKMPRTEYLTIIN
jgi:hypothetical protein